MLQRLIDINDCLLGLARTGSLWIARLGGALLIFTVAMITIDIISRSFAGRSILPSTEYSGYVLAICSSWAFSYALLCKAHIRIDVAYLSLPAMIRSMLDILALVAWLLFSVVVVKAAWGVTAESLGRGSLSNTPMQTPLWIPEALWVLGLLWFAIVIVLLLARVALAAAARDPETIQTLVGSATLDEQLNNEGADP